METIKLKPKRTKTLNDNYDYNNKTKIIDISTVSDTELKEYEKKETLHNLLEDTGIEIDNQDEDLICGLLDDLI